MSNGNASDLNDAIRIEIQRIIQSFHDTIPDTSPPLRTNTAPHENTMYIQFLETIAHDYNQNIREYQSNIRCIFQILYELIAQQRQRPTQEPSYTLPPHTNRSQQYYQTDHSQRFPRTGSRQQPQQPARGTQRSFREPTLTQILQNLSFRPTAQRRQPMQFQDVIVRPTPEQISSAVNRFQYDTTLQLRNTNCPITLEDFQEGDPLIQIIYCQHCFHEHALENWFQQNVRCPVCRYDIRVSTERPRNFRSDASTSATTSATRGGELFPENNANLQTEDAEEEEEEEEETVAPSESQSRIFFRGNVESSPNSHPLAQTFFNGLSEEFTNILNEYMNQGNVSIPRDISENQIYRFEIPIYYNEYYDGSDNLIGIEPVD